jgi:TIR domain
MTKTKVLKLRHQISNETAKEDVVKNFCNVHHLYVVVGVLSVTAAILAAVVIVTFVSESVRVRLYHHKFFGNFFLPECDFEEKDFDVFVSYAEEDVDLAIKIAQKLEGKFTAGTNETCSRTFRCCLHQRDWIAGKEISRNIIESVEKSLRTVVLLSRHFLNSPFCLQEFGQVPRL